MPTPDLPVGGIRFGPGAAPQTGPLPITPERREAIRRAMIELQRATIAGKCLAAVREWAEAKRASYWAALDRNDNAPDAGEGYHLILELMKLIGE